MPYRPPRLWFIDHMPIFFVCGDDVHGDFEKLTKRPKGQLIAPSLRLGHACDVGVPGHVPLYN